MRRVRTYYDLFGLPFGAPEALIKQRYRELAKRLHPDVNPSPDAAREMQRLNEAYRVLTTPHLRLAYHMRLAARTVRRTAAAAPASRPVRTPQTGIVPHFILVILLGFVFLTALVYHWMHPFPFQRMNLSSMGLHALPPYLYLTPSLQRMDLSDNHLTSVPPEIYALPALTSLNLSHNALTLFPTPLMGLTHLEDLNLSYNRLSALPIGIGEMYSLRRLILRGNRLETLPEELFLLPHLELLDVRENPLSSHTRQRLHRFEQESSCQVLYDRD